MNQTRFNLFIIPSMALCAFLHTAIIKADTEENMEDMRGNAGDQAALDYAQVNGVRLAFRIEGSGFPVVFVHGETYSHELWARQMGAVQQRYQFISYDRRGHGQSDAPFTGYSPMADAHDLNALLTHLGIGEAHFVVHSRGGAVIMQFLLLHPRKVRSLTFADASIPLVEPSPTFKEIIKGIRNSDVNLKQAIARREAAKRSSFTHVAQSRPEIKTILERMVDQYSHRVFLNPQRSDIISVKNIGPWNPYDFPDMAKLQIPALLVVGELTDELFLEGAQAANQLWPDTRHHTIPRADHLLMLEEPEIFNQILLDFLAEIDARVPVREDWANW